MDGIAPALAPSVLSPKEPGWSLSGIGVSGLAAASTVLLFLCLTARFIWMYNKAAAASAAAPAAAYSAPVARPRRAAPLSLFPVFVHMAASPGAAECAVCLSELEEREAGRLLPGCGHGFHEECIATWLRLNTTCPVCRAPVATK